MGAKVNNAETQDLPLSPLAREHLGRLKAEWQLQALTAQRAKERFEAAAATAAQEAGVSGSFELNLESGVLNLESGVIRASTHQDREG